MVVWGSGGRDGDGDRRDETLRRRKSTRKTDNLPSTESLDAYLDTTSGNDFPTPPIKHMMEKQRDRQESNMRHRIQIQNKRWIYPGDYIVHKDYGIGQYTRRTQVDLTPDQKESLMEPAVVVRFADGEITWFLRLVERELMFYMSGEAHPRVS